MAGPSGNEDPQSADGQPKRRRLTENLDLRAQKRKRNNPFDLYRKFVWFNTRTEDPFVNYNLVLEAGRRWEFEDYGKLSKEEFQEQNRKHLKVYQHLRATIPQVAQEIAGFQQDSSRLDTLARQLNDAVTSARGSDISTLREAGLRYVALEQPNKELVPNIDPKSEKKTTRGHNHPTLSRLLCPGKYLKDFDANPEQFRMQLLNNEVKILAGDFPALLYSPVGYDPQDPESGLLRNPTLVRFFKHIFTAPTSAKGDLSAPPKVKTKQPQLQKNNATSVTPGSIVYAALMFRHCISALNDWRTENDVFDRALFAQKILDLFEDPEDMWTQDTLTWWNTHIFGNALTKNLGAGEEREPSTADLVLQKRAARKAAKPVYDVRYPGVGKGVKSNFTTEFHSQESQHRLSESSSSSGGEKPYAEPNMSPERHREETSGLLEERPGTQSSLSWHNLPPRHNRRRHASSAQYQLSHPPLLRSPD